MTGGPAHPRTGGRRVLNTSFSAAVLLSAVVLGAQTPAQVGPERAIGRSVEVPFDYERPTDGVFPLYYELGRTFDAAKPTVFIVVDGQQFYVQKGAVPALQDQIFGDAFNVVGIAGRGANTAVLDRVKRGGAVDWATASRMLRSDQWVEDLERVRRAVVGEDGKISLYGRSGGGLLVHQYLSRYPDHVRTVFTQAAVNRFLDARLGLNSDTFWMEIGEADPSLRAALLEGLHTHGAERNRIVLLLQRQNFFVPAAEIRQERAALIHAIRDWDQAAIDRYSQAYQVDAVLAGLASPNPAINVRLFELFAPLLVSMSGAGAERLDPDIEVGRLFSAPLMPLLGEGRIDMPSMDLEALHLVDAGVYLLAGRFDHTADYRSQIALASRYPDHRLLLLADDHTFSALQKTGLYGRLVQAALADGPKGPAKAGIEEQLEPLIYREY